VRSWLGHGCAVSLSRSPSCGSASGVTLVVYPGPSLVEPTSLARVGYASVVTGGSRRARPAGGSRRSGGLMCLTPGPGAPDSWSVERSGTMAG
jgi:hypothetical protein